MTGRWQRCMRKGFSGVPIRRTSDVRPIPTLAEPLWLSMQACNLASLAETSSKVPCEPTQGELGCTFSRWSVHRFKLSAFTACTAAAPSALCLMSRLDRAGSAALLSRFCSTTALLGPRQLSTS
ncbi:hypothetical protein BCR35DRAFT_311281 [Leucosporidium creatinivorum]|uniref:Uncharacterized protein n=1 Tax=Leucosporidium creatinivorum TaxID=106004 RepID=A0A1Y2C5Z1_9BASI|nr:hypothetical protein BCR35DRAFT_311281 [Leucosporidium creatinivorum]